MNKTLHELIIKRNRELDLAHQALTPESRKKHWKEINRLNEEIRRLALLLLINKKEE